MKYTIVFLAILLGFFWADPLDTQSMSGGEFEITADTFSFLSGNELVGEEYSVFGSGESVAVTTTEGGNFVIRGGFQATEVGLLSFSLDTNSVAFGELSDTSVTTGNITATVSTDSETGYTLSISEDGNLRSSAGDDINDVSDGQVTAGSEEYGISTSGSDGLLSSHTGISGSLDVASSIGTTNSQSTTISFHASRSNATPAGDYSHRVTFTITVNP